MFGAATATDLYTGRLAFAFGALPALGAIVALDYRRNKLACALAVLSALCSPVAALFAALAAGGYALGGYLERRPAARGAARRGGRGRGAGAGRAARDRVPGGRHRAVRLSDHVPGPGRGRARAGLVIPKDPVTLRAGVVVYALATLAVYLVPSPIGSNIARLGTFLARRWRRCCGGRAGRRCC